MNRNAERARAWLEERGWSVSVESFPSGACWLDVPLATNTYLVIECAADGEVGVSVVGPADGGFGGHDDAFASIDQALAKVESLLDGQTAKP